MTRTKLIAGLVFMLLSCGPGNGSAGSQAASVSPESIPGNYSMKMVVGSDTRYSTAIVKSNPDGSFQIARITVYGPVNYSFQIGADASSVSSEELGKGQIVYQPSIKKTTIRFEKEGALCELSR